MSVAVTAGHCSRVVAGYTFLLFYRRVTGMEKKRKVASILCTHAHMHPPHPHTHSLQHSAETLWYCARQSITETGEGPEVHIWEEDNT